MKIFWDSQRRFGYVQNPKAACTSIKCALAEMWDIPIPPEPDRIHDSVALKMHQYPPTLKEAHRLGLFLWSVVRNPFDRLLSTWAGKVVAPADHYRGGPARDYPGGYGPGFRRGMTFADFVKRVAREPLRANPHISPQAEILFPAGEVGVHEVLHFESLQRDWKWLSERFALPPLPHHNRSEHRHYRAYYDDATRKIVEKRFARDLHLWAYLF